MPQEVSHCKFCVVKDADFKRGFYLEWECKKGHELTWSKVNEQLNLECIIPLKNDKPCVDYAKGFAHTLEEMKEKLVNKNE